MSKTTTPDSIVRRASMNDFHTFLEIMVEAYTTTEPISRALGVTRDEAEEFIRSFLPHYLPLGYSLLLECDGEPQGIMLFNIVERSENIYEDDIDEDLPPNIRLIEQMVRSVSEGFWSMMPPFLNRALHGLYLAIRPGFHGRGGLAALSDATNTLCAEYNIDIVFMECLNEFVLEAYRPMGFMPVRSLAFSDWRTKDGAQLVPTSQKNLYLLAAFTKPTMGTFRPKL